MSGYISAYRQLAGRSCIVTGAGSQGSGVGNGRATAIAFARQGGRVLVVDQDPDAGQYTVDTINADGGEAKLFVANVTEADACEAMVHAARDQWGRVDVLVNNVGIDCKGSVVNVSEITWDHVMDVNVKSAVLASKFAIPAMIDDGGGAIVNISSVSALRPKGSTAYSTSKGAIVALTRAMAVDHGPDGIRVNCVVPGPVYTPMVSSAGMSEELRERRRLASVLQIEGTAWDIANAVLFLVSDESRYITGVTLLVDGGVTLRGPDR